MLVDAAGHQHRLCLTLNVSYGFYDDGDGGLDERCCGSDDDDDDDDGLGVAPHAGAGADGVAGDDGGLLLRRYADN